MTTATTATSVSAETSRRHRRRGSSWRMFATWSLQEIRLLLREPVAVFFSLAFPMVIYVFMGIPYGTEIIQDDIKFIDIMFPSLIGTVISNLLLMGLPIYIAELRNREVDKRYQAIPLPGVVLAMAIVTAMTLLALVAGSAIALMVHTSHGLRAEGGSLLFILLNVGLIAMLCPLGFYIGTLKLAPRTIQALTAAVFFILFFGSGAATPLEGLPPALVAALEWNPLKIWFDSLIRVYLGAEVGQTLWLKIALTMAASAAALWGGLRNWRRVE